MSFLNLEGAYENELAATGEFNPNAPHTALMLPSGQRVVLPTTVLLEAMAGDAGDSASAQAHSVTTQAQTVSEPMPQAIAPVGPTTQSGAPTQADTPAGADAVIPLVAEELRVGKTQVETARVRLRRETEEHTETVSVPLEDVRWEVEHVPIEKTVDAQPEIRQVGDTIIFPLVEERLVVKRELWLREEVHVHKVRTVVEKSADFPLKRDVLVETRDEAGAPTLP